MTVEDMEAIADVIVDLLKDTIQPMQERLAVLERTHGVGVAAAGPLLEQVKKQLAAELGRVL